MSRQPIVALLLGLCLLSAAHGQAPSFEIPRAHARLGVERVRFGDDAARVGLVGASYLVDVGGIDGVSLGPAVYAAVSGNRGGFFALGLHRYLSFEALREHHGALTAFVEERAVVAALLFVAVYAASTAASLPGGLVLTVTGGLLFGTWLGALLTVVGATTGGTILFLVARSALGGGLRARAGGAVERLAEGFREGAFSYLLVLRLVPLMPFFVVNLAPAFLGVPLRTFVAATLIGILPGTLVYSSVGAGLGSLFAQGGTFTPGGVLTPQVVTALVGLAALALVPVAYRRLRSRRPGGGQR